MKNYIEIMSFVVILGGSLLFGFLGQPAEMALAIVAGAISLSFANLEKFSKIRGAGFEAELKEKIETVIEKETEQETSSDLTVEDQITYLSNLSETEIKALECLNNPKYTWRTASGISKELGLTSTGISGILSTLIHYDLVKETKGPKGKLWALTSTGRSQLIISALSKSGDK